MHEKNRECFMTDFEMAARIRRVLESPPTRNHPEVYNNNVNIVNYKIKDFTVRSLCTANYFSPFLRTYLYD